MNTGPQHTSERNDEIGGNMQPYDLAILMAANQPQEG